MSWEKSLVRHETSREPLHAVLGPSEFLNDTTFLTKDGYLAVVIRPQPVPFETLDAVELDNAARQFEKALRNLDPAMRVYQYVFKRSNPTIPSRVPDSERIRFMRERAKSLYSLEFHWVIVYEKKEKEKDQKQIERMLRIAVTDLSVNVAGFLDGMRGTIRAELLTKPDIFRFFRRLLNYDPCVADGGSLIADWNLDEQIADSNIEVNPVLRIGPRYARVLTLKRLPKNTFANILRELLDLRIDAVLVTEWKPIATTKVERMAAARKQHFGQAKVSLGTKKDGNSAHGGKEKLEENAKDVQTKVYTSDAYFGDFGLTIILHSETPLALTDPIAKATNAINNRGGAVTEQIGKSALAAWLACVPGTLRHRGAKLQMRTLKMDNTNYADMSFLFAAATGRLRNEYLRDEYLCIFENTHGQFYFFNLHPIGSEVGHTVILGKTGVGKTYLTNFLVHSVQKIPRVKTIIFDVLHGFKVLTQRLGGSYVQLGHGGSATINPFCMEPTDDNVSFLFNFIRFLIESDHGPKLGHIEQRDLDTSIRKLYRLTPELRMLRNLTLTPRVDERLDRWVTRHQGGRTRIGQYAYLFDNPHDSLREADFQTFNFPNLKDNADAMEALVFYVIHWTQRTIEADPAMPKFVFMDEALEFLRHPDTQRYVQNGLQRWRHFNTSLVLVTQSLSHFEGSVMTSIKEQCATRLFAANPGIDAATYAKEFNMTLAQAELITRLTPCKQFLHQDFGIIELHTDPLSHALYSNSPYQDDAREKAIAAHGFEEGLRLLAGVEG